MGRFKKIHMLFILLIGIFLLTGCNNLKFRTFNASEEESNVTDTSEQEKTSSETEEDTSVGTNSDNTITSQDDNKDSEVKATPTTSAIQPSADIDLPVYTVNAESGDIELVTALIPADSEIIPQLIVDTVVEAMADQSIEVGIESVTTKDDAVIVSFYKDKAPLSNVGSVYEVPILDAIAQSLLDNLTDYSKIIYRAEGKEYSSGHIELELDEVYLGDH